MNTRSLTNTEKQLLLPELEQLKQLVAQYQVQSLRIERLTAALLQEGEVFDTERAVVLVPIAASDDVTAVM
jgi:hypothetical protein